MPALDDIAALLAELRTRDATRAVFGATLHGYRTAPATRETVEAFEARWNVRLPDTFRALLLELTDGGAGPGFGLFPLAREHDASLEPDLAALAEPFDDATFLALQPPDPAVTGTEDGAYDRALAAYWRHLPGTLTLCTYGSAIHAHLVVTGALAGQVLIDKRCDRQGVFAFSPATGGWLHALGRPASDDAAPCDVTGWYLDWLRASLASLAASS